MFSRKAFKGGNKDTLKTTMMDKKTVAEDEGTLKTTWVRSSEEPDVTIIVGGKTFYEHSRSLRCWSEYFDTAFRSGMKEATTKTFEFPDRDPEEWNKIVTMAAPFSTEVVNQTNLRVVLSWFDELCCPRGLKACDKFLSSDQESKFCMARADTMDLDGTLDALATSIQYDLTESKQICFRTICRILDSTPEVFSIGHLTRIVSFTKSDMECQSALWESIEEHVPSTSMDVGKDSLLSNDLFPSLLHCEINRRHNKRTIDQGPRARRGTPPKCFQNGQSHLSCSEFYLS